MNINTGKHTYGRENIKFIGGTQGIVNVGKYCSLGENIQVFMSHDHNIKNISSYPFGHPGMPISKLMKKPLPPRNVYNIRRKLEVNIGNDVFIGSNTVIFREVTIGDGAVIGAYSTITRDVPPYYVVAGNDRVIRRRIRSDKDIEFLLKLKWWDFSDEEVAKIGHILCSDDVEALKGWARENEI